MLNLLSYFGVLYLCLALLSYYMCCCLILVSQMDILALCAIKINLSPGALRRRDAFAGARPHAGHGGGELGSALGNDQGPVQELEHSGQVWVDEADDVCKWWVREAEGHSGAHQGHWASVACGLAATVQVGLASVPAGGAVLEDRNSFGADLGRERARVRASRPRA